MALIKRKGEKYYRTRFTLEYKDSNGQKCSHRFDKSTKETHLNSAKRYELKYMNEMKEQLIYGVKPKHTWQQAADRWIKEKAHKRSLRDDNLHFSSILHNFRNVYVEDTTRQDIENLAAFRESVKSMHYALPVSPATVNRMLALVKSVLNRAYKHWGWIDKVPYISMRKESKGRVRYLTEDEMRRILEYSPHYLRRMILATLQTGLRESNIRLMEKDWINLDTRVLIVPAHAFKTNKNHSVYINDVMLELIRAEWDLHPKYVFTRAGTPISQCNNKDWKKTLIAARIIDFRWHDLRHTLASWMAQRGESSQKIQAFFNWDSPAMVNRYSHMSPQNLKELALAIPNLDLMVKI